MNKFDVKKLIKVSAVALAMISAGGVASTVNASTNAHADEDLTGLTYADATKNNHVPAKYAGFVKISDEEDAKEEAHYKAFMAKLTAESEPGRKADALSTLREGGDLDSDVANDPVVRNYLESKGYSSNQINNSIDTPEKDEKQDNDVANEIAKENNKIAEYNNSEKATRKSKSHKRTHKASKRAKRYVMHKKHAKRSIRNHQKSTKRFNRKNRNKRNRSRKLYKRINRKRNRKNRKHMKRSHRIAHHHYHNNHKRNRK